MQEEEKDIDTTAGVPADPGTESRGIPMSQDEPIIEPEHALPEMNLEDLPERLKGACARAGWTSLLPVQARAIPYVLAKRNLMVQSQTGSGKTAAFVLPILERINPEKKACQALVLVPTRELAGQVAREAETLGGDTGIRTAVVYGGVSYGPQLEAFKAGAQFVIGTPGRILDHLIQGTLSLKELQILVFDEADRMLSMGFYPDMRRIQQFMPKKPVSGYMFSATFSSDVLRLAGQFLQEPEFLSLSRDRVHVTGTDHVCYLVPGMQRERSLVRIIEMENPTSAIVFCNTKATVHFVTVVLQRFGYDADELSSDLSQAAREKVMARVKKRILRFLVATDVAARGIDIQDLSHVIQYEPPEDPELYIHRAGRTGRVGAAGTAISIVAGMEQFKLKSIAKTYNINMEERTLPSEEDVVTVVSQRITAALEADLRGRDRVQIERMQRFISLGRSLAEAEAEIPVIAMLLDDYYQRTLQAPVVSPSDEETFEPAPAMKRDDSSRQRSDRPKRRRPPRERDRDRDRSRRRRSGSGGAGGGESA